MACFSIVSVSVSLSRLSQYIIIVKGEIHVLQWGEEVFNVALLEFPDQKHTHLIQFILRHPQPFTSLISMKKKNLLHVKDTFLTAMQIMKHRQ